MVSPFFRLVILGALIGCLGLTDVSRAQDAGTASYALTNTFQIGGVGGWDYVRLDPEGKLLFVTRNTHTNVIDTASGKVVADIPGQGRSHGVALVPELGRGFISDGKAGCVVVFDLKTYATLGTIATPEDADGIIYDPSTHRVLVSCGDAGALAVIAPDTDLKSNTPAATVELGGKPEYLVADGQGKVYVALVDKAQVAAVDIQAMKVLAHWSTAPAATPVGMSIDPATRRLFVGCRSRNMIVMSADDGHIEANLPIGPGVDATAFDRGCAFASCDKGITVIRETSPGQYAVIQTVPTPPNARTLTVDPHTGALYLPVSDMTTPTSSPSQPRPRATQVPGTFKILVVERGGQQL